MRWTHTLVPRAGLAAGPVLMAAMLSAGTPVTAREQGAASPSDYFAGDLTIRHQRVTADGRPVDLSPPAVGLRLERRRMGARWRTTLAVTTQSDWVHTPAGRRSLDNPFTPTRVEFEDDGQAPRMYGRGGQLIAGPTPEDIRALGLPAHLRDRDWEPADLAARAAGAPAFAGVAGAAAGLVHPLGDRASRRRDLERRYGAPVGQVRGLDRFLAEVADSLHEVLVDPETALPIEINVADRGALVRRVTFDYQSLPNASLLRRLLRNEEAVAEGNGMRLVTEVELTNVRFAEGGR